MPDGFVVTRDGQHEIFRWDDIASVWQAITVHKRYGMTVSTTYNYTIQRSDGCKIVLNNNTKGIDKLGQEIQNQFTRAMLPKAIETLNPEGPELWQSQCHSPRSIQWKGACSLGAGEIGAGSAWAGNHPQRGEVAELGGYTGCRHADSIVGISRR